MLLRRGRRGCNLIRLRWRRGRERGGGGLGGRFHSLVLEGVLVVVFLLLFVVFLGGVLGKVLIVLTEDGGVWMGF